MSALILHHYWQSPFAHKIRLALGLIGASWTSVEIPRIPPKPFLIPLTAGYRRTPVLQHGADVFCDTQNIARAIGELTDDYRLIPRSKSGQILTFTDWIDGTVFNLAVRVILTSAMDKAPPEFIRDRAGLYFGSKWTPDGLIDQLSGVILQLGAHLKSIDRGLSGSGGFATRALSYADISIACIAWFIRGRWEHGPIFLKQFHKPIYLINTSRGACLDTKSLVTNLNSGKVLGACIDVLEYEKTSFENLSEQTKELKQLLESDRVILSPHIAGWTQESQLKIAQVLFQKIIDR